MSIHQRLLAVISGGAVAKDGKAQLGPGPLKNVHTIDGVVDHLRPLLVKYGVLAIPEIETCASEHITTKDKRGEDRLLHICDARVSVTFVNVDEPADIIVLKPFPGQGFDYSDKATGKAVSYALKTLYLAFFQLRGQPDPEQDDHARSQPPKQQKPKPQAQPKQSPKAKGDTTKISDAQVKKLFAEAGDLGLDPDEVKVAAKERWHLESLRDMTVEQLQAFLNILGAPGITDDQNQAIDELAARMLKVDMEEGADWLQLSKKLLLTEDEAGDIITRASVSLEEAEQELATKKGTGGAK
jgi:hypothetical protein